MIVSCHLFIYLYIYLFAEVVIHLCLHALILENKVTKKLDLTSQLSFMVQKINFTMPLYAQPAKLVITTIHNTQNRSAKPKHFNNKCYAQGYAGARGPESQWAIINAVEHCLSGQSLISAKEEDGTAHPPNPFFAKNSCLDRESITVSTSLRALDQFSHILITMSASN